MLAVGKTKRYSKPHALGPDIDVLPEGALRGCEEEQKDGGDRMCSAGRVNPEPKQANSTMSQLGGT